MKTPIARHLVVLSTAALLPLSELTTPARGIEPLDIFAINAGPTVIRPHLSAAGQYNDNITGAPSDFELDDFIFIVSPGFEVEIGRPGVGHEIKFGYDLDAFFYLDNSDYDGTVNRFNFDATFKGDKWTLTNRDNFRYSTTIIQGQEAIEEGIFIPREAIKRWYYSLYHQLRYAMTPKSSFYARGTLYGTEYNETSGFFNYLSRNTWKFFGGFAHIPTGKVNVFGEGYYGQTAGNPSNPSRPKPTWMRHIGGFVGADGDFTPKLNGEVKIGVESADYADERSGIIEPVARVALNARFNERYSSTVSFDRRIGTGSLTATQNQYQIGNYFRIAFRATLGGVNPWFFNVAGRVSLNNYTGALVTQRNTYYGVEVGVFKQIRAWLVAGVGYEYEIADRSISYDYDQNAVTVSVRAGL